MIRTMYEVQVAGGAAVARKSFTVVTICECNNGPAGPCGGPPMNHPLKHPSPPLLLVAATVTSRLAFFGVRVAGVNIAFFGGIGAALMLLVSGSCMWCLGQPGVAALPEATRLLHLLAFVSGGPGFAVTFGLLVLGVSLAGGLTRRLPRWLMWGGIAIGVVAELSSLSLLATAAAFLLPMARFSGLLWLIAVGVCLPAVREPAALE